MITLTRVFELIAQAANKNHPDFIIEIGDQIFHTITLPNKEMRSRKWKYQIGTVLLTYSTFDKIVRDQSFKPVSTAQVLGQTSNSVHGLVIHQVTSAECRAFMSHIKEIVDAG